MSNEELTEEELQRLYTTTSILVRTGLEYLEAMIPGQYDGLRDELKTSTMWVKSHGGTSIVAKGRRRNRRKTLRYLVMEHIFEALGLLDVTDEEIKDGMYHARRLEKNFGRKVF